MRKPAQYDAQNVSSWAPLPTYRRGADYIGRFLLLEDNELQQRSIRRVLEQQRPVDIASSISEARARIASRAPYIGYVFDVNLPDGDGVEFLAELKRRLGSLPASVIVTAYEIDRELVGRVGALSRLLPKAGNDLSGREFLSGLAQFADESLDYERHHFGPQAALFDLSDGRLTAAQMEVAVLGVYGYTRAEIAKELGISVATARSHIRDVLLKTGLRGQGLIGLARAVNRRRMGGSQAP
ncbi:MAG: response regulator [Sandaracinaceae bacterium]